MFNVRSFYEDYGIEYHEGNHSHKHCRPGWIQTECILCSGNPGLHLGFSEKSGQFVCWRCGFHPIIEIVRRYTGTSWQDAKHIAKKYGGAKAHIRYERAPKEKDIEVEFPEGILDFFPKRHKQYLRERNFDADYLIDIWGLRATGKRGKYHDRIIAPIYYNNRLMSYQGRDITDEAEAKYMACEEINERRHHKYCLYGIDLCIGRSVLVVEGITDVWNLGIGAVATFGIKYTDVQTLLLIKHFDNIYVMFDETEDAAQQQARRLVNELNVMGKYAEHITLGVDYDPAELSHDDVQYLKRELLLV